MGTCAYISEMPDRRSGKGSRACGNPAHGDEMCKFHLDGYLNESTAGEVRSLFWSMHDAGDAGTPMDCTGYVLPPLAREGAAAPIRRALRLNRARFGPDGAGLSETTFEEAVLFRDAEFAGATSFSGCTFKKGADFRGCTFKKGADFSHATFLDAADFESSRLGGMADFLHADFTRVTFDWATLGKSKFNKAVFHGDASFYGATFGSAAEFNSARFLGESRFEESEFERGGDFAGAHFEQPAYFRGVKMKRPKLVRFDGNISNVSFLNTDLKEVGFGSMITWSPQAARGGDRGQPPPASRRGDRRHENERNARTIWDKKWRIHDERIIGSEVPDPAVNLENVCGVYRDLRDNFDQQLRYDVAGGFFVREMELGRKYRIDERGSVAQKPLCRRILTWHAAYNVLAEYGQSLGRPSLFLTLTLAAGSSLLWCNTGVLQGLEIPCEDGPGEAALRSLVAMVPLPLSGHFASPVDIGLKLVALPAVATFLVALRRRFEKTRRH